MERDYDARFCCDFTSCGQSFQSAEALHYHQKKHSLTLRLTADDDTAETESAGLRQGQELSTPPMPPLRDEMPTPSRFLKEFQRNSAFLDEYVADVVGADGTSGASPTVSCIVENPFAETFRRSSFSKIQRPVTPDAPQHGNESESLNTPSIMLNASNEHPLLTRMSQRTAAEDADGDLCNTPSQTSHSSLIKQALNSAQIPLIDNSSPEKSADSSCEANIASECPMPQAPDVTAVLSAVVLNVPQLNQLPIASSVSRPMPRILPKLQSEQVQVLQVTVKTADGSAIRLPVVPKSVTLHHESIPCLNVDVQVADSLPNPCAALPVPSNSTRSDRTGKRTGRPQKPAPQNMLPLQRPGRKRKEEQQVDNETLKRLNLDRNRQAAHRCRLKKKLTFLEAEEKAQMLFELNTRLQGEVESLRHEVQSLKTALLAHRECPVTLQQLRLTSTSYPSS